MTDHQPTPQIVAALRPLKRRWWVVALAALVCASAAFVLTTNAAKPRAYGLINTRAIATLPNDRADLINDIKAVVQQNSVLEAPAEAAGMTPSELRDQVTVQQIGTSSLLKITLDRQENDEQTQALMQDLADSMSSFMTGNAGGDSDAEELEIRFNNARETEAEARRQVTAAIIQNGGIEPEETYRTLVRTGVTGTRLEGAAKRAASFQETEARLALAKQATLTLQTLWLENGSSSLGNDFSLPVAYQGEDETSGDGSTRMRRTVAGGAAGALLAAALIILLARRREQGKDGDLGERLSADDSGAAASAPGSRRRIDKRKPSLGTKPGPTQSEKRHTKS